MLMQILNRIPKGEFIPSESFMEPSWMRHGSARISRVDSLPVVKIISLASLSEEPRNYFPQPNS